MRPDEETLIQCIRDLLVSEVRPQVPPGRAIAILDVLDTALCELLSRFTDRGECLAQSRRALTELIGRGRELAGHASERDGREAVADSAEADAAMSVAQAERCDDALRKELGGVVERVFEQGRKNQNAQWMRDTSAFLQAVVTQEIDFATRVYARKPLIARAERREPDAAALARYFARKLDLDAAQLAAKVERLAGGNSRETYFVTLSGPDLPEKVLVLRKEVPGGIVEGVALRLADEYQIIRLLHDSRVTVPRPMWLETDASVFGAPFIVVEKVAGSVLEPATDPTKRREPELRNLARALAQLHAVRWQERAGDLQGALSLPTLERQTARSLFEQKLVRWADFLAASQVSVSPALTVAFQWLRNNIPDRDTELCLIHGDLALYNILFGGGEVTALLDWELADLGDPARDLAQIRPDVTQHLGWEEFLDCYREAGGRAIPESAIRYYQVFNRTLPLIVQLVARESKIVAGSANSPEMLSLGYGYPVGFYRHFASAAAPIWS